MAKPRFLFDEDLQGAGGLVQKARSSFGDVWVIGHQPCTIKKKTPDEVWLPKAAQRKLIIFRIDTDHLNPETESYRTWRDLGCRGFILTIQQSKSSLWDQTKALVRHWDKIKDHAEVRSGDKWWIARLTAGGIKPA